ncbi:MAG: hypothetical protein Q8P64_01045, partial [Deltaproteobacteria bacterium]|nr:hypothetical protein [Deltaproteobacteria bacterium]
VGNLGVYDGSGLFLGYLTGTHNVDPGNQASYQFFNPDIPAMLMVIMKNGSSWKSVGKLMSLKQYNMASDKGKRAFQGARKSV